MRTYTISREGLRSLVWRSARTSFAVIILLTAIVLRLRYFGGEDEQDAAPWALAYLLGVVLVGTWLSTRSTRRLWQTYRLEVHPDGLRRTQYRQPEISIARGEIRDIEEMPGRGLTVRTAEEDKFIYIPVQLQDYEPLREELSAWGPLTRLSVAAGWRRQWLGIAIAAVMVAWMISTLASTTPAFVIPSAFAQSVFLLWGFIAALRSRYLDRRTRLWMWVVLLPVLGLALKTTFLLVRLMRP